MSTHQGPRETDDDLLRTAVTRVLEDGWEAPAGQALLRVLEDHCRRWAPAVDRHCALAYGTTAPHDLLTEAWRVLHHCPDRVLQATSPWAYLWNAVRNAAAVAAVARALGSDRFAQRSLRQCRDVPIPLRMGDQAWRLGQSIPRYGWDVREDQPWSPALHRFLDLLEDRGADRELWAEAIERAVEVMSAARRSYEELCLRRDSYLRQELGLAPCQLRELAALLIGTRRGHRAEQSLLLALHRDLNVQPDAVPDAVDRIQRMLTGCAAHEAGSSQQAPPGRSRTAA